MAEINQNRGMGFASPVDNTGQQPVTVPPPAQAAAPVLPAASDWEDVPSQGSGVQSSDSDWEDVPQESYMQHVNAHAGDVLKGIGKDLANTAISATPLGALQNFDTHIPAVEGVKKDLEATNGAQIAGKAISAGGQLLTSGAGEALTNGVRDLTVSLKNGGLGKLLDTNVSGALHTNLGQTLAKVANEAGVEVPQTSDVRKVIGSVADAIRDKAQAKLDEVDQIFKGLSTDDAPQGLEHYSDIQDAIAKKQKDLAMLKSSSTPQGPITTRTSDATAAAQKVDQKSAQLKFEISALQKQKSIADDALDAHDLKGDRETADKLFKQADDLEALRKAHAKSTFGPAGNGQTNPAKFHEQITPLHDSGQLTSALGGEDHAQEMMNNTQEATRLLQRNAKVRTTAKYTAAGAALGKGVSHVVSEFIP